MVIKLGDKNEGSIEKPFWQAEWHNIKFKNLDITLSADKLASSDFYSSFYTKLFSTYKNAESLPPDWLINKTATAEAIEKEIGQNAAVLSYGCGLGFVEKQLARFRPDLSITAFDFAETAARWIKRDLYNITYTRTVQDGDKYEVIYLCQVLYALSFSDSVDLLKSLSKHLKNNGKLILINTSITDEENREVKLQKSVKQKLSTQLKALIRTIYRFIFPTKKIQFWGWERNNDRYIEIATAAGLKQINIYSKANQAFIILGK
jgi:SAM-dependent methyltransferase